VKQYPSIPRANGSAFRSFDAYLFGKLDGSSLRFEWNPKTGWSKAGSRHRLLDAHDPILAPALALFQTTWDEPLARIARDKHYVRLTAFLELYGPHSLAGQHLAGEPKTLTLFDVAPFGGGLMAPAEFLRIFGALPIAPYLGQATWTRELVERIRAGQLPGATFEGVVGKGARRSRTGYGQGQESGLDRGRPGPLCAGGSATHHRELKSESLPRIKIDAGFDCLLLWPSTRVIRFKE
jgi:hypothetical protein